MGVAGASRRGSKASPPLKCLMALGSTFPEGQRRELGLEWVTHRGTGRQVLDQRAHGPEVGRLYPPWNAASTCPTASRCLWSFAYGLGVSFPWAEATPSPPATETALGLLGLSPYVFVLPPTLPMSTGFRD